MDPEQFLDGGRVTVSEEQYTVFRSKRAYPDAFATIQDGDETTVIIAGDDYDEEDALDVERDWRRLSFDLELPFDLVGFLAAVSSALAEAEVSILAISTYSTDHILVKSEDVPNAVRTLQTLGCDVATP